MRPWVRQIGRLTAVAGGLVLAATPSTLLGAADSGPDLRIVSIAVDNDGIRIELRNLGGKAGTGTVVVRVRLADGETGFMVPVAVEAGQKAFVQVAFEQRVREVLESRVILDDGSPF